MKLMNITNIDKFFKIIDSCKGNVKIVSKDWDCINMKSNISQFISFEKLFAIDTIDEIELICEYPEDTEKLMDFMINGN